MGVFISFSQVIEFLLKKGRFLVKNQHTLRKLFYFVNRPGPQNMPKLYFQSQFPTSKTH